MLIIIVFFFVLGKSISSHSCSAFPSPRIKSNRGIQNNRLQIRRGLQII
jgi:hypothetical protein